MNIDSVNEQYYMGRVVKTLPSNFGGQPQCKGAAVKLDHLPGNNRQFNSRFSITLPATAIDFAPAYIALLITNLWSRR